MQPRAGSPEGVGVHKHASDYWDDAADREGCSSILRPAAVRRSAGGVRRGVRQQQQHDHADRRAGDGDSIGNCVGRLVERKDQDRFTSLGATAASDRLEVRVDVSGLKLDRTKIGLLASQNAGISHWHVYVDGSYAGLSVSDVISLPNDAILTMSPGLHEIKVQPHNTDHKPLTPEGTDSVTVTLP